MYFKRLFKEAFKKPKSVILGMTFLIGTIFCDLGGPFILKYVLDEKIPLVKENPDLFSQILFFGFLYFLIGIANTICTYSFTIIFAKLGQGVISGIRKKCYQKIQELPIDYFSNEPDGKIVAKITNDTNQIRMFFSTVLGTYVHSLLYIVGIVIALYLLKPQLALVTIAVIPVMIWVQYFRRFANKYNVEARRVNSQINARVNETIKNVDIIQAFNYESYAEDEFKDMNDEYIMYRKKILNLNALFSGNLVDALRRLILFFIIVYFGSKALNGVELMTLGTFAVFYDYVSRLMNPLAQIFNNLEVFERAQVSAKRVYGLLDEEVELNGDEVVEGIEGEVVFEDVTFSYVEGTPVLKNINFTAKSGESIALVGHTGSGKSSLMNLLLRFYELDSGKVLVDGKNINDLEKRSYRRHVGIVLQDPVLFNGTIGTNISLKNPDITDEMIYDALDSIGAREFVDSQTNKLDEKIIDGGANLSFGERQLVAFARAMLYDPEILVLDEATANIDTETELIIQNALKALSKDRTTFIIAHRLSTIKDVNKILVLEAGEIKEMGNHDELLNQNGIYREMYISQVENSKK